MRMAGSKILAGAVHLGRRVVRRKVSIASTLFVVCFCLPLVLYVLLGSYLANDPRLVPHAIRNARNVLLITAHPDDECLFFSPSILQSWGKPNVNRHILVLSSGAYPPSPLGTLYFDILSSILSVLSRSN